MPHENVFRQQTSSERPQSNNASIHCMASRASSRGGENLEEGPLSPGPIYYPKSAAFGDGPTGKGVEYSMRPSHRVPAESMHTTQATKPGPKYMLPTTLGRQVESTKRSQIAGLMSQCPRKTIDVSKFPGKDSPGPAAYNRGALGLTTMARQRKNAPLTTGLGVAQRFFDSEGRSRSTPGPGAYPVPESIGGKGMPHKQSKPVYGFSKSERDATPPNLGCSPGPVYKLKNAVGRQVDSKRPSSAKFGFGTSSRFPVSAEERREHTEALKAVKRGSRRPATAGASGASDDGAFG